MYILKALMRVHKELSHWDSSLYSCGHVFDIEKACSDLELVVYVKAKCRPTMRKNPVFYKCFVKVELIAGTSHVVGGNWDCPAGETQSCSHLCLAINSV